jgi:hypothetical protein
MNLARRVVIGLIALVALVPSGIWAFAAGVFWSFRNGLFVQEPPQAVETNIRVAVVTAGVTALNLTAILLFLLRSRRYGWWLLVGVEVGNAVSLLAWMILGSIVDIDSIVLFRLGAASAAFTLVLLVAFRFRRRPGIEGAPQ